MASITIRRLDESVKARLRVRAAKNGRSMEEEAREILKEGLRRKPAPKVGLGTWIHQRFAPLGGLDIEIPPREAIRDPPTFE